MRLFIAIQFTPEIKKELTRFQNDLKRNGLTGRFVPVENLHLTLAFIGEYPNPDDVLDVLEQVPFTPFDLSLGSAGQFGDLYWCGIDNAIGLEAYVRRLRRALAESGIPFDKKKFSPHITLVRRGQLLREDAIAITKTPEGAMHASRVSLIRSDRGKAGMIYTEVGAVEAE
ncbi:MAG: RNA 2',3'-cyclic phosphodiesterase [Lachnospiraceae bacterium]|nr:RNA 2',3'-cyclic phosphodiesterase [Lachnospiraceae bacterium]